MSKSIAPFIPIVRQAVPFATASLTIGETHRPQKALPMRLPISSALPNPPKQRSLQRHEKMQ